MPAKISVSKFATDALLSLDAESVLSGPDRDPGDVFIDPIMAARFEDALTDYCFDAGLQTDDGGADLRDFTKTVLSLQEDIARTDGDDQFRIVPATSKGNFTWGVLALSKDEDAFKVVGLFTGSTLCVDNAFRGKGIGTALAVARLLQDGSLPTWEHDEPGYSSEGARTIQRSLEIAQNIIISLQDESKLPAFALKINLNIQS